MNYNYLFTVILLNFSFIFPMQFRQATTKDIDQIIDLINTQAYKDSDKVVIVPEKFRQQAVANAIQSGRLFVATNQTSVIAYKKLFCITDDAERDDILHNELRCHSNNIADAQRLSFVDQKLENVSTAEMTKLLSEPSTYIYTGADFTHSDFRSQGINAQLTGCAFESLLPQVVDHISKQKSAHIALVYGLTKSNAGNQTDLLDGRSKSILKQFIPFVEKLAQSLDLYLPTRCLVSRYHAFKPSFDAQSTVLQPLSDDQSIPGYGYVIACHLNNKKIGEVQ